MNARKLLSFSLSPMVGNLSAYMDSIQIQIPEAIKMSRVSTVDSKEARASIIIIMIKRLSEWNGPRLKL